MRKIKIVQLQTNYCVNSRSLWRTVFPETAVARLVEAITTSQYPINITIIIINVIIVVRDIVKVLSLRLTLSRMNNTITGMLLQYQDINCSLMNTQMLNCCVVPYQQIFLFFSFHGFISIVLPGPGCSQESSTWGWDKSRLLSCVLTRPDRFVMES